MQKYEHKFPGIATDIIIEYRNGKKRGIVLIERKFFPFGLAIPGGLMELGLTAEENAIKEAKEETGLDVKIKGLFGVYSEPKRDPREHMISLTYVAEGNRILKAGDDAKEAFLFTIDEIVQMIGAKKNEFVFDHKKIISDYLMSRGHLK